MSSNWDGRGQYQGAASAQAQQSNSQVAQAQGGVHARPDIRSHLQLAESALDKFDAAVAGKDRFRRGLDEALDALLSGVPDGPLRDALHDALAGLVAPLLAERRANLVAELVSWAQRA